MRHIITCKELILLVDDQTLFWAMKRHWNKGIMMPIVHELSSLQTKYRAWIWFEWIPTQYIVLADPISRFKLNEFWHYVKQNNHCMKRDPCKLSYAYNFELYHDRLDFVMPGSQNFQTFSNRLDR